MYVIKTLWNKTLNPSFSTQASIHIWRSNLRYLRSTRWTPPKCYLKPKRKSFLWWLRVSRDISLDSTELMTPLLSFREKSIFIIIFGGRIGVIGYDRAMRSDSTLFASDSVLLSSAHNLTSRCERERERDRACTQGKVRQGMHTRQSCKIERRAYIPVAQRRGQLSSLCWRESHHASGSTPWVLASYPTHRIRHVPFSTSHDSPSS